MRSRKCVLVIHNVRSAHNVGAMFRTADGAGIDEIILSGYTATPPRENALHYTEAEKSFQKTALGAEKYVSWRKVASLRTVFTGLKKEGFCIAALEQNEKSIPYQEYRVIGKIALLVGNEVRGIDAKILKQCDVILEIPMRGKKNSLNVSVATGIALYQITSTIKKRKS